MIFIKTTDVATIKMRYLVAVNSVISVFIGQKVFPNLLSYLRVGVAEPRIN